MKTLGSYFFIILLLSLFIPRLALADWYTTVSGDVYSNLAIDIDNPSQPASPIPADFYASLTDSRRGSSGVITYTATANNAGLGSEDDPGSSWLQRRSTSTNHNLLVASTNYQSYYDGLVAGFDTVDPLQTNPNSNGRKSDDSYCANLNTGGPNNLNIYRYSGTETLTIDCMSAGGDFGPKPDRTVVIFSDGDVIIKSPIIAPTSSTSQNTFFMLISRTRITFSDSVSNILGDPAVSGVFIAPQIDTSDGTVPSPQPLVAEGVFYALGTFNLNRRIGSSASPSETFLYKPSFLVSAPPALWKTVSQYGEVEP